jgi:putative transposase
MLRIDPPHDRTLGRWHGPRFYAGSRRVGRIGYGVETYIKVQRRWYYLYRAIDTAGALVDVRLSETRAVAAATAFFQSAQAVTGITPARITTDGHDTYPRVIRIELGEGLRHRTNRCLSNRIEQDHRDIKGRNQPMRGFESGSSAARSCQSHDELRNFLRFRTTRNQHVLANHRRLHILSRSLLATSILKAA